MGTRGLICAVINGEFKLAQYCQWDMYLEGSGQEIVDFISNLHDEQITQLASNLAMSEYASDDVIEKMWQEAGANEDGSIEWNKAKEFSREYPTLSRDTGADILPILLNKPSLLLQDALSFANDSLFCEWAYVLDLDELKLEIYRGFVKEGEPCTGRFYEMSPKPEDGYLPVTLYKVLDFEDIATKYLEVIAEYTAQQEAGFEDDEGLPLSEGLVN